MAGNDVSSPATFLLTRNAALDLRRIHTRSHREWGEEAQHQVRDIVSLIADLTPAFHADVERLKRKA